MMPLPSLYRVALIALLLVLAACSRPPTKYEGDFYSPEAEQVGENLFEIKAWGNSNNSQAQVEAYGLVKAAETTQANGHSHFKIVDNEFIKTTAHLNTGGSFTSGYELTLDIETFPETDVPEDGEGFFPAATIIERLGPSVRAVQ